MSMQSEACQAAAHVARMSRWHAPGSPEVIAARRALISAKIDAVRAELARLQRQLDDLAAAS